MVRYWTVKRIKPSPFSVTARLPEVYQNFLKELQKQPAAVHYIPEPGKWKKDPVTNEKKRVNNVPIPLIYPKEADEGIWGGEGVIKGYLERKPKTKKLFSRRKTTFNLYKYVPNYWVPQLKHSIVYSEILNKYMTVTVTERALNLIDKHHGFDNYILEEGGVSTSTPVQDLKSQLALDLRRKMLLALADKKRYYDDTSEQEKVWEKYKKFEIPKEEAEWFGLTLRKAVQKQRILEEEAKNPVPLKHEYRKALLQQLKESKVAAEEEKPKLTGWLSKIPLIGSKT